MALVGVRGRHAPAAFTSGKDPVPIVQEAGWAPGPVWTAAENLAPTGIQSPDHPSHSSAAIRTTLPGPWEVTVPLRKSTICICVCIGYTVKPRAGAWQHRLQVTCACKAQTKTVTSFNLKSYCPKFLNSLKFTGIITITHATQQLLKYILLNDKCAIYCCSCGRTVVF